MITENNTWNFGEKFSLTVDDTSLTKMLCKHQKEIGVGTAIDRPVKRVATPICAFADERCSRSFAPIALRLDAYPKHPTYAGGNCHCGCPPKQYTGGCGQFRCSAHMGAKRA